MYINSFILPSPRARPHGEREWFEWRASFSKVKKGTEERREGKKEERERKEERRVRRAKKGKKRRDDTYEKEGTEGITKRRERKKEGMED